MTTPPMFDISAMERRLEALEAERTYLVGLITAARAYESTVGKVLYASPSGNITMRRAPVRPKRAAPVMEATENIASELMERAGRPVTTNDIVSAMRDQGLPLPERNATNVISARLSNSRQFKGRRGEGWWFVDRPWPDEAEALFREDREPQDTEADVQTNAGTDQ